VKTAHDNQGIHRHDHQNGSEDAFVNHTNERILNDIPNGSSDAACLGRELSANGSEAQNGMERCVDTWDNENLVDFHECEYGEPVSNWFEKMQSKFDIRRIEISGEHSKYEHEYRTNNVPIDHRDGT
jgi:hypothetical protein